MKKNYKRILKASNAVEPAAPASIWGKGVPGKGGTTQNYDSTLTVAEARARCYGRKAIALSV